MAVTPWAQNFPTTPGAWSYSTNAGATWTTPAPTGNQNQVPNSPTGTQRYRQVVTIPAGVSGTWTVAVSGDLWDTFVGVAARLVYDGVDRGPVLPLGGPSVSGPATFTLPAVPGTHTLEVWVGQSSAATCCTNLTAQFGFTDATDSSAPVAACGCCPTELIACATPSSPLACAAASIAPASTTFAQQHATPTSGLLLANPHGYGVSNTTMVPTYNQNTGGFDAWVAGDPVAGDSGLAARWSYSTPVNDVWGFSIWHGYGNVLNDGDGVASATLDVYAGATLLFSGPIVTGNGGQEWQTNFPGRLNGVTHFELSHIGAFGVGQGFGIREVALNYPWRGTLTENCAPAQISASIEAQAATFASGLTLVGGVMGQTNGPHDLTWTVPPGVTGVINTNTPADFSSLAIANGTVTTVSGNHNRTFSVTWTATDPAALTQRVYGLLCNGAITWVDSGGYPVPDPTIVRPCL